MFSTLNMVHPFVGVAVVFNGGVFGGETEGVPAHGVEDGEAAHPFVAGEGVADGVVTDVSDVQGAAGVGQHFEHVVFGTRQVREGLVEGGVEGPALLPFQFDALRVVGLFRYWVLGVRQVRRSGSCRLGVRLGSRAWEVTGGCEPFSSKIAWISSRSRHQVPVVRVPTGPCLDLWCPGSAIRIHRAPFCADGRIRSPSESVLARPLRRVILLRGLRHFWSDGVGLIDRFEKIPAFFYQNELGNQPVRYSILGLSSEDRRLIGRDIQKVEFGWPLGMPCCRNLGDGRWEVRSDLSGGKIGRVLFCVAQNRIVLLHGFVKKTRKTPSRDLQVALRRMKEVL